jgi:PAS domain S-box-containing protein
MNLRTKTFLIILVVWIFVSLAMVLYLSNFIKEGAVKEDAQITRDKVGQLKAQIEARQLEIATIVQDWATWDDTYNYLSDRNHQYIHSKFASSTFFNYHLNFASIYDSSGNLVFSQYYTEVAGETPNIIYFEAADTPQELSAYLNNSNPFLGNSSGINGIISLPGNPMYLASYPILPSQSNGPIRGTLIFGRYLDQQEIQNLPGINHLKPQGFKINDPSIPVYFPDTSELTSGNNISVRTIDEQTSAGFLLIPDIQGHPAYIVKIETPRVLYTQAKINVTYYSFSLVVFGLLVIVVILFVLEKLVISRISLLSGRVAIIGRKGDLSTRLISQGKDEISSLAGNINGMLASIEQSRQLQQDSETFNLALLNDSPIAIEVINPDGSIRYANPALEKLIGYTKAQVIGRKPPFPWWPTECIQQYTQEFNASSEGPAQKYERKYFKPDNTPFWVELSSTAIQQNGKTVYMIFNWVEITESKNAFKALGESEKRFRELAELLPELVFETNLQGKLTFANRIVFSVFGYLPDECLTLKLTDLIAVENRITASNNIKLIIEGEELGNSEYTAISKNGRRFPIFIHATQIKDNSGVVTGLRGILVDISRLKEIESELRASEEYSTSLLTNAPNPIIVFNPDFSIRFINPALESLTGFNMAEVEGIKPPLPWWPATMERQYIIEDTSITNNDQIVRERLYRKKNGQSFWVNIYLKPIREDGIIQYFLGNWVDITERKLAEDALRDSEEFSSSLRDNSPFPIMVINPDTSIRYVNPALEKLSGFSADELIGQRIPYTFFKDNQKEKYEEIFPLKMQPAASFETLFRKKSGESFYVDITSTPIMQDAIPKYFLIMWVDVTAQKLVNEQLEQLYQREKAVREALQVEIKSRTEFTRALVHELKTPLTPIMASSELLVEELSEEPLLGLARNVYRGAENMNRRVDELLDLARGEVGILKVNSGPVDPEKLIRDSVKYMELVAKNSGQKLAIDLPDELPVIIADDDRVRQVLFNLINNSIKYSAKDGEIKISARVMNDELVVEVKDQGRGMTQDEQAKLFQPYYRIEGREHLSGLGLGLALSRKLIELQNGRIWASSEKDKGSTFSFSLPIKRNDNPKINGSGGV